MNRSNVSKSDILLAIAELCDKLNVFEINIIASVKKTVPENENAVHEKVIDTKETVEEGLSCVKLCEISKDVSSNVHLLETQGLWIEAAILKDPLFVNWKFFLTDISVDSVGIDWQFQIPVHCMKVSCSSANMKTIRCQMLPAAVKLWFTKDRSEFFKPFKELLHHSELDILYPSNS